MLIFNFIFFGVVRAYAKLEIIFPTNNIIVYSKKIHIVGRTKKKIYPKIIVNSQKVYEIKKLSKIKTDDGIFYIFCKNIILRKGFNLIDVKYNDNSSSISLVVKLIKNSNNISDIENFKTKFFHMNEKIIFCKKCHKFSKNKDCIKCHIEKKMGRYLHGPVAAWQCFVCHDKNNYYTVNQPLSMKCLGCHQEFSDAMYNAKYAHAPSVVGNCIICHTPHASKNKYFLYKSVNKICSNCHKDKLSGFHILKKDGKNHRKLKCVSCHNPHYGESKFLFIKKLKNKKELCKHCHKKYHGM